MDRYSSWLLLGMVFGMGGKRLWQVMEKTDDPAEMCERILSGKADFLSDSEKEKAERVSIDEAERLIELAGKLGQQVVCIGDEDYPKRWYELEDAPALAFYRGDISIANDSTVIHTVGTREPSKYTLSLINVLCADLALRGFTVSCGLAEGSDTCTAETVLGRDGRVLAVYPTSLDREYPKDVGELKDKLVGKGLLISEYPPEYGGRMNFHRRNKLAVALASAVVITEASEESKGLDNAVRAMDTGRPVMVVPPHLLYSKRYFGQRDLLRKGCIPIFDGSDAVRVLAERQEISAERYGLKAGVSDVHTEQKQEKIRKPIRELSGVESKIYELLKEKSPMSLDEMTAISGLSMMEVLTCVTGLELEGIVISLPGKRYELDS
ncbi:MAG: DNA-protecting protein DprA [Ruminococcus sp.]|uniref:DNA-processing protein DprA n=1 Tax=Ruminococcus sp. TaxID=41978 RepID=UPI0025EFF59C|nr:DNA-processing protein DprA [Ruminococcus sp.]MBO4865641.1 DNA-protecting protein DprA [Ruminococcus sp.]